MTLPLTAGPAASAAIDSWADTPRVAAAALLWLAWAAGLLATLAPRPQTLTALRVIAPALAIAAILATIDGGGSTVAQVGAVVATLVCAVLASGPDIASAAANSIAYGDEQRFPLRVPPALFLGPLPIARLLVAGGVVAPVLLLANGDLVLGLVALVVGAVLVFVLSRSLSSLSRRWAVLVPAGFVVVDPLTLADPVLFLREHVRHLAPEEAAAAPPGILDLRLGAGAGSVSVRFDEEVELVRAARGRHGGETVAAGEIRVAVARRHEMLTLAAGRRLPVRAPVR
ncbi:MAG: hypothetical protein QOF40_3086 [Actinomycetota bacterium]|nr:hypothetical protein [Actinomycetota bacterium]